MKIPALSLMAVFSVVAATVFGSEDPTVRNLANFEGRYTLDIAEPGHEYPILIKWCIGRDGKVSSERVETAHPDESTRYVRTEFRVSHFEETGLSDALPIAEWKIYFASDEESWVISIRGVHLARWKSDLSRRPIYQSRFKVVDGVLWHLDAVSGATDFKPLSNLQFKKDL